MALPGGLGTFEELFEVITWAQIGLHRKPIGLLNTNGYFDLMLGMITQSEQEGFIYREHRQLFTHAVTPTRLLAQMKDYRPPEGLNRWVDRDGEYKSS